MTFFERNTLIENLQARGFKSVERANQLGWLFTHTDGFRLEFNMDGKYSLRIPSGYEHNGSNVQNALPIIDTAAAEL